MNKRTFIAVDDDVENLRQISHALGDHFNVLATRDPKRALQRLETDPTVAVIAVDQVLSSGLGVDLLESARQIRPGVRRVLLTAYTDLSAVIQGLHTGAIERLVSKPLKWSELESLAALNEVVH